MNKEEAIEQLQRLSLDWEEEGLNTKLNQTDINAIGMVVSELETSDGKLDKIKEYVENYKYLMHNGDICLNLKDDEIGKYILLIIDGNTNE